MKNMLNIDINKIVVVTALMVVTTFVVVGSTWTFISLAEKNIAKTRDIQRTTLERQLIQLKEAANSKEIFEKNNQVLGSSKYSTN